MESSNVRDPECAAFGFGRRSVNATCPPTYTAITHSLFLPQYMSRKTPKRQVVILNCILCSQCSEVTEEDQDSEVQGRMRGRQRGERIGRCGGALGSGQNGDV